MTPTGPNPRTNVTPHDWRRVGIAEDGDWKFQIVWQTSRVRIFGSDLKCARLSPELKTDGLTMAEALKIGAVLDKAFRALLDGEKEKQKSFDRRTAN